MKQAFDQRNGGRPEAVNVLILVTDGRSSAPVKTKVNLNIISEIKL